MVSLSLVVHSGCSVRLFSNLPFEPHLAELSGPGPGRGAPECSRLTNPDTTTDWVLILSSFTDFVVAKVTHTLETDLGYKLFLMFATINIGGMAVFSL